MNAFLKIFLSMSFSGGLLILVLLFGKRFLKDKVSRQWQYYIWLVVILRLLIPFNLEINLMGQAYREVDQAITHVVYMPHRQIASNLSEDSFASAGIESDDENINGLVENLTTTHQLQDIRTLLVNYAWLIWFMVALGLLIRKITIYQSFAQYIHAGLTPISDIGLLNRLSVAAEQAGVKKSIELCVNPLISSPLLIGFFHPCIILPRADIQEKNFQYIVLHELMHYKRCDIFYKWLIQITICLHWFNPLVYLMGREITKACEFSCDEAILIKVGSDNAHDYGTTLLDAMVTIGRYKENMGVATLSENKQILKERLGAIMKFRKQSRMVQFLTVVLTLCVILCAAFVGTYTMGTVVDAASKETNITSFDKTSNLSTFNINALSSVSDEQVEKTNAFVQYIERYYEAGSLPLFEIVFSRLDEEAQRKWLDRIYTDDQIMFWISAIDQLEEDCILIQQYAEKLYRDDDITYFSVLVMHMSEEVLEKWLDKALEDENWAFQSVLFDALDRNDEFDELEKKQEKEWEEAHIANYQAVGVTIDGKNYYYQGKLVHIFLDIIRSDRSFHTLDINPKGTVNIKIIRDTDNKITGVAYMTEAEVIELLGDMVDSDN